MHACNNTGTKIVQAGILHDSQPLKYPGGWSNCNKHIYLSENIYECWQSVRALLVFHSDNELAKYYYSYH